MSEDLEELDRSSFGAAALVQPPPDIADFTGRPVEVAALRELLVPPVGAGHSGVRVCAIAGRAGIGKTTLAVHVAHRVAGTFPDGVLYADMGGERGFVRPEDVLGRFLRALGVSGQTLPSTAGRRAELYRARLVQRRVLVLLDDAAAERQVRPLLPWSSGCAALLTGRARLAGLDGAAMMDLDVLEAGQAVDLLARVAGQVRVSAEPEAARRIVELCGRLPLAVRIAGARLRACPHWSLSRLADRLHDRRSRLDEPTRGDLDVRASFTLSYEGLDEPRRRAFRVAALLDAPSFAAWALAAALEVPTRLAEDVARDLADAHLLEAAALDPGGQPRYRLHDLLRLYGRERAGEEDPPEERAAAGHRWRLAQSE